MKETVKLETFDGHIVLLCKGWYNDPKTDFFDEIKRLWAVRCGIEARYISGSFYEYIANHMFEILLSCEPERMKYFHQIIHKEISGGFFKPENMTAIQKLIWEYRSAIHNLKIKTDEKVLVELPKPQKRIINRIIRGGGVYGDYQLLTKADKRVVLV